MKDFIEIIKEREIGKYIENVSLKKYTSYKVGGIARCIVYPKNVKKLIELLRLCKNRNVKYKVLGNGTNTLFSDKEFDGIIIKLDEFKNDNPSVDKIGQANMMALGVIELLVDDLQVISQEELSELEFDEIYNLCATNRKALETEIKNAEKKSLEYHSFMVICIFLGC